MAKISERLGILRAMANPTPRLLAALAISTAALAQAPLTVSEALSLKQVANPQMGDGFVAFNVVVPRPIEDGPGGSYLNVGVAEGGAVRMLVDGKRSAGSLAVRPGTRQVSFRGRAGDAVQVLLMDIDDKQVSAFAETPAVSSFRWRPDGRAVAFTSLDPMTEQLSLIHI